jgi:hypothetical protein
MIALLEANFPDHIGHIVVLVEDQRISLSMAGPFAASAIRSCTILSIIDIDADFLRTKPYVLTQKSTKDTVSRSITTIQTVPALTSQSSNKTVSRLMPSNPNPDHSHCHVLDSCTNQLP